MNTEELCAKVSRFVKPIPKTLRIPVDQHLDREILIRDFLWVLNTSLFSTTKNAPISYDQIFDALTSGLQSGCHFNVEYSDQKIFKWFNAPGKPKLSGEGPTDEKILLELCKDIYGMISRCPLSHIELRLIDHNPDGSFYSSHFLTIFIYANSSSVTFSLYDALGYKGLENQYSHIFTADVLTKLFSSVLEDVMRFNGDSRSVKYLGPMEISCRKGMQYIGAKYEPANYCYFFNLFWVYITFKTISHLQANQSIFRKIWNYFKGQDDVILILKYVESSILDCEILKGKPEVLMNVIYNFAIEMFNSYVQHLAVKYPADFPEIMRIMNKKIDGYLKKRLKFISKVGGVNELVPKKKRRERISEVIEPSDLPSTRGEDGSECKWNSECLSDYCNEIGICEPYPYDTENEKDTKKAKLRFKRYGKVKK